MIHAIIQSSAQRQLSLTTFDRRVTVRQLGGQKEYIKDNLYLFIIVLCVVDLPTVTTEIGSFDSGVIIISKWANL